MSKSPLLGFTLQRHKLSVQRLLLISLLAVSVIIAGSASMFKSMGVMIGPIKDLEQSLGGAIYLHALVATSLGAIAQLTAPIAWRKLPLGLSYTIVPLTALVTLDEALQYFLPARHFAWIDMGINVVGVISGAVVLSAIQKIVHFRT